MKLQGLEINIGEMPLPREKLGEIQRRAACSPVAFARRSKSESKGSNCSI